MALVKAVAAGSEPLTYISANTTALNQAARAFKGTREIAGVRQYNDVIQASRGA
jgi:hypothetical protein